MYNLLEERENIKNKLKNVKKETEEENNTVEFTDELNKLEKLRKSLENDENEKQKQIDELIAKIKEYKTEKQKKMEKFLLKEISNRVEEINTWKDHGIAEFNRINQIKCEITNKLKHSQEIQTPEMEIEANDTHAEDLNEIMPHLSKQLNKMCKKIKNNHIAESEKKLESVLAEKENLINSFEIIHNVIKTERIFNEQIFTNLIYSKIYDEFSFHFFTEKETNRLDKPEWYFQFLSDKLRQFKFICKCYDRLAADESVRSIENSTKFRGAHKNLKSNSINLIISKIYDILEIKINEIRKSKSKQRRNLLFYFIEKFLKFKKEIMEEYQVDMKMYELSEIVLKIQKNFIIDEFDIVQSQDEKSAMAQLDNWFLNYEKIYKENFLLAFSYVELQSDIFNNLILFISTSIVEYLNDFIERLNFYSEEEKQVFSRVLRGVCDLKRYLREEELKFLVQIEKNQTFFKHISVDNEPIHKFINENLVTLKKIVKSDFVQILMNFSYFDTMTDEKMIKYTGALTKRVNWYFKWLGTHKYLIESFIFNEIDEFVVAKIILQRKFDSDKLFLFRDFVKKISNLNENKKEWKCLTGYSHLKSIFNGNTQGDEYFAKIYSLYQQI